MSTYLLRLGTYAARHPKRIVAIWLLILVSCAGAAAAFGGSLHDDYNVPGTASQAGTSLLTAHFSEVAGADARVVLHDAQGLSPSALGATRSRLTHLPHVTLVSAPQISTDGRTALIQVQYDVPVTSFTGSQGVDELRSAVRPAQAAGAQVDLGGSVPENTSAPNGLAEAVGIISALIILVVAFRSLLGAALPIVIAGIGLGAASAGIACLAGLINVSTIAPTIASMVGLGVGIDYALLIVSRHFEGLDAGLPVRESAARATAKGGESVVFAGLTVLASLLGLRLAGLPVYASFGYATAIALLSVMLAAITLVPALCSLAGPRLVRSIGHHLKAPGSTSIERWANRVGRRPLPWALGALLLIALLAAPVFVMRTWPQDASSQPTSNTTRRAYDEVASAFGPGANGPFVVAVDLNKVNQRQLHDLVPTLQHQHGVASVTEPFFNASRDVAVLTVTPTTAPDAAATSSLLNRLRSKVLPGGTYVTGWTAEYADVSARLSQRIWLVIAFVVGVALVLLTAVFRSIVVAVKAALMNLLSVAAAYGVMVALFQWGWGVPLLGIPHAVPVSSWVPILMFTVLFGLSMDYEVFLLSRVREDWLRTGDARGSVVRGLSRTGRVITSAAAIMVAVFTGFALDPDITIKMMGTGMAVAVFLDATVVRMVLVPSTMALLGAANWWTPRLRRAPRVKKAAEPASDTWGTPVPASVRPRPAAPPVADIEPVG
jgi:putative drug exporter of the RND superfamily